MPTLRADLHVHSCHSRQSGNFRFLKSRDCYSRPEDVYRVARARGMDLVTITDHDSIGGCLEYLDKYPTATDFFISEEVSCRLPTGDIEVHLGVYGQTERLHRELQPLRRNVFDVTARLREAGVFFTLNHLLHFYRGQIPLTDYLRLIDEVPALEVRNGAMLRTHNTLVESSFSAVAAVGGSDAHTLRRVGRTWTEAPGVDLASFLESVRQRRSCVGGMHGTVASVLGDAYGVIGSYWLTLVGRGPRDHTALERIAFLLFSLVSLPAQFLPLTIVASGKRAEARQVRALEAWLEQPSNHAVAAGTGV
jgi:predicted metal-dependent phosphoesterase TrpH